MNTKLTVAIVGFGRFGKTLYRMMQDDFSMLLFNRSDKSFNNQSFSNNTRIIKNIKDIYRADVIFYSIPIDQFERVIKTHKIYFTSRHVLIDVLSVKEYPKKIFKKYLKNTRTQAILTHPMFGPDSSKNGFNGLNLMMNRFTSSKNKYEFWKNYFIKKGINVVEMKAQEHDKLAARSQGVVHFIGRLLKKSDLNLHP